VTFKNIKIQNFFSFGPELQELDLSAPGMYLITGKNNITSSSNGSGKSSLFDAICYALFGQVTKNVNIPQIVNEQTGQDCMVELEFEIDGETYIIERWKKQKKHYDKLLLYKGFKDEENLISQANKGETQIQINDIIKFNYKSFINAVMMTQEQVSGFLQADISKKKEIIENILQLNILTKYHWIAQQKRKILKRSYEQIKLKEESAETLIENTKQSMQEYVDSCNKKKNRNKEEIEALEEKLAKINTTDIDAERETIAEAERLAKEQEDMMVKYQHAADKVKSLESEKEAVESTKLEYTELLKNAEKTKKRLNKELKSEGKEKEKVEAELAHTHENPDTCPVCENHINEDKINIWITTQEELLEKINNNISSKNKQLEEANTNVENWTAKSDDLQKQIDVYDKVITKQETKTKKLKEDYQAIEIPETMDETELNELDEKRREIEQQIRDKEGKDFVDKKYLKSLMEQAKQHAADKKTLTTELKELKHKFIITKWWEDSLSSKKNSMKSWCINNVIGYFNSKIKFYIDRFFEGTVSLQLDNNLNEVIAVNDNERVYDMFSGGEKRRLNLAILFALNDLVKANVSSKMNIMFLDEVLSNYLDDKGISSVLEVLQDMSDGGDNSIFVIDHKDNFKDYPSFINITVVKGTDGYSRIQQETNYET
jgi:DNA repair exonuclease SbcCD ATPase subunit